MVVPSLLVAQAGFFKLHPYFKAHAASLYLYMQISCSGKDYGQQWVFLGHSTITENSAAAMGGWGFKLGSLSPPLPCTNHSATSTYVPTEWNKPSLLELYFYTVWRAAIVWSFLKIFATLGQSPVDIEICSICNFCGIYSHKNSQVEFNFMIVEIPWYVYKMCWQKNIG